MMKKVAVAILCSMMLMQASLWYESTTKVDAATEVISKNDFESGKGNWFERGSAIISISKDISKSGLSSLKVSNRTASWHGVSLKESTLSAGETYFIKTFISYATSTYVSQEFNLTLQYIVAGETNYSTFATTNVKSGNWAELSGEFTIPSSATDIEVVIETPYTSSPTTKDLIDFYIDDVELTGDNVGSSIVTTTPSLPISTNLRGDVNGDGVVDLLDGILVKYNGFSAKEKIRSDIDGDGKVDSTDTKYIRDLLIRKTTEFPAIITPEIPVYEKTYNFPAVNQLKSSTSMPDPFVFNDGSKVTSPSDWPRRANEIRCMYEYYMYGKWRDGSDDEVSYKINGNNMTITIKRKSTGVTKSFPAVISRPSSVKHPGGSPVIIGMHSGISESTATAAGYTVITIGGTMFSNPVASDDTNHTGTFYDLYPYGKTWEEQTGVLMAWSWGCSKILDALYAGAAKELNVNPDNSIVTGVSRWGKATIVCGAFDERFKMVAPSCSGAGGTAIYRYTSQGKTYDFSSKGASANYTYGQNEPLGSLQSTGERGWFNNRFLEFTNVNQLPMDQHMLTSVVADKDRYLFIIGSCIAEDWVNAPSMWLGYKATKVVYDYLDIADNIAINIHKEGHAVIVEDMNYMCQYFDKHVYGMSPTLNLNNLKTSVFDLPKNTDPYFSSFGSNWIIK